MARYIMVGRYSPEALKGISAKRTDEAVALIAKHGGKLEAAYALLGKNDLLLVADYPDVQDAMQASVALAKATGIGFNTSPAVTVAEFDKLMAAIG
ncbi:MAG: GYD domain-containing protein [Planctomycetia bacterium]|nr:GYD domain-containing protein [Planctomycetia bacterium]